MKKRFFTLLLSIALVTGNVLFATNPGDTITLDLNKSLNPTTFSFTEKGNWSHTYNDVDYPYIEFNTFAFSHIANGMGYGFYWDGFTVSTSGDNINHGAEGNSQDWINNQWGCMAGGGIKTDANGNIMTDQNGDVMVEQGNRYLMSYWGFYMESPDSHSLNTIFNDGNTYEAVGMYVCNHPWPYFGNLYGDGFARPFEEGDSFKLIIHGLDENYENTEKSVEHTLAEYKDGQLIQSPKWEWVDLSSLGEVGGLYYTLETTDADPIYGPNTAVYFCMDKLQVRVPDNGTITNHQPDLIDIRLSVYPSPFANYVTVETSKESIVEIYNLQGQKVFSTTVYIGKNTIHTAHLPKGVYFLHCADTIKKIMK